jgi:hypothetical protein
LLVRASRVLDDQTEAMGFPASIFIAARSCLRAGA